MSENSIKFMKAQGNEPAQLFIFDEIGFWGYNVDSLRWDLSQLEGQPLDVHIASLGGSVHDGIAIYNTLLDYKGIVTTYADSIAASIASVIFMAGDKRVIADNGSLMTHKPMAGFFGNSSEIDTFKSELEFFDEVIARSYARSGLDEDGMKALIENGDRWIDSQEAIELGLATEIKQGLQAVASVDLSRFDKVPGFVKDNHKSKSSILNIFNRSSKATTTNQGGDSPATQEDDAMSTETIAKADHEAALAKATADATAEAQKAATDRIVAIHALDSAKGKDALVAKLIANVSLSVEDVDDILKAAPEVKTTDAPVDELDGLDLDSESDAQSTKLENYRKNIGKEAK